MAHPGEGEVSPTASECSVAPGVCVCPGQLTLPEVSLTPLQGPQALSLVCLKGPLSTQLTSLLAPSQGKPHFCFLGAVL